MRVGQFLGWLCGAAPAGFAQARLLAAYVPEGVGACSPDTLGRAVCCLVLTRQAEPASLLRFLFGGLSRRDEAKGAAVIDALASLDLRYPEVPEAQRQELAIAKKELTANDNL